MDRIIDLHVYCGGIRVDRYISQEVADLSRSFVQRLIKEGRVLVNGEVTKPSYNVESGDLIILSIPPPQPVEVRPEDIPLRVIYEDCDLIVVDKPAGMVVHPAYGHSTGTLVNALLAHCSDLSGIGGELRPGIVHRLDKDTSGLLVVAKNDAAHRNLQHQFKQRLVRKTYLGLCEGRIQVPHGVIDAPIGRAPRHRKRMAVVTDGRAAQTEYRAIEYFIEHTLVEAVPVTGRTHQIRIHLASIGHPIAGDRVYGYRKQSLPLRRHFLHASKIAFLLPSLGRPVEFISPLPPDLTAILEVLRAEKARL